MGDWRAAVEVVEASVQVASASMDAQAVLDEAHVEEEEDVNDVPVGARDFNYKYIRGFWDGAYSTDAERGFWDGAYSTDADSVGLGWLIEVAHTFDHSTSQPKMAATSTGTRLLEMCWPQCHCCRALGTLLPD